MSAFGTAAAGGGWAMRPVGGWTVPLWQLSFAQANYLLCLAALGPTQTERGRPAQPDCDIAKEEHMNGIRWITRGVFLAVFLVTSVEAAWTAGNLEIYVFNIGQGDSQLIVSPSGKTLLIDVGEMNWNSGQVAQSVAAKIRQIMGSGCNHLDYIVATHLHLDHIGYVEKGGIWALLEKHGFTVGKLIDRDAGVWQDANGDGVAAEDEILWHNVGTTSGTAWKWVGYVTDPANAAKLHREIALVGSSSQIDLGPGVTVTIVESDAQGVKMADGQTDVGGNHLGQSNCPSENDYSITLKVTFDKLDYVAGADTDGAYQSSPNGYTYNNIESVMASRIGRVEVLRVNHHGSDHSSSPMYLNTLDPDVSVITCGSTNTYGHPDQDALDRLLATSKVYLTEKGDPSRNYGSAVIANGDVMIKTSDGVHYTVNGDSYVATDAGGSNAQSLRQQLLARIAQIEQELAQLKALVQKIPE